MKCSHCGAEVPFGRFCMYCGAPLEPIPEEGPEHQNNRNTREGPSTGFLWVAAIVLFVLAIILLFSHIFAAIVFAVVGILFCPPVNSKFGPDQQEIRDFVCVGCVVVALIAIGVSGSNNRSSAKDTNSVSNGEEITVEADEENTNSVSR